MFAGRRLRVRIVLGFCVPILMFLVVAGLSFAGTQATERANEEVAYIRVASALQQEMLTAALETETRIRGYLLSGDEFFLTPLNEARLKFSGAMAEARNSSPNQQELQILTEMEQIYLTELLASQDRWINLRRESASNMEMILKEFDADEGRSIMDKLRAKSAEMDRLHDTALAAAMSEHGRQRSLLMLFVLGGAAVATLLGTGTALLLASSIVRPVSAAVNDTVAAATEVAATAEQLERAAQAQSAAVTETTVTLEEVNASAKVSSEQAVAAAEESQRALEFSVSGEEVVSQTLERIANLREKMDAISDQILRLSEHTSQVGMITNLVSDLANQTNMLALNAAVEAARAGEHGRGFAVVASEIRRLADQSRKSAERITGLLGEIQASTNATVLAAEEGAKTVDESAHLADRTFQAFQGIAGAVTQSTDRTREIALGLRQQTDALQQIAKAMATLNTGARDTAAAIIQSKVSADSLKTTARDLESTI